MGLSKSDAAHLLARQGRPSPRAASGAPSNGGTARAGHGTTVKSGAGDVRQTPHRAPRDVALHSGVAVESDGRLLAWVPGQLSNPNNGSHKHWSVKAKTRKEWRKATFLCVLAAVRTRLEQRAEWRYPADVPKVVVLTAFVWNLYDEDGLAAALKPCVDGLRDAKILHDDSPRSGHRIERRQVIDRKHRGVEVVIEPRMER